MWWLGIILIFPPSITEPQITQQIAGNYQARAEVICVDGSRCDIVTPLRAVEVAWLSKWPESIGQSIHYGRMLRRRPAVIWLRRSGDDVRLVLRAIGAADAAGVDWLIVDIGPDGWAVLP